MGNEKNPFESVQAIMLENLEKVQGATQSYIDMVAKAMGGFPGADEVGLTESFDDQTGLSQEVALPAIFFRPEKRERQSLLLGVVGIAIGAAVAGAFRKFCP